VPPAARAVIGDPPGQPVPLHRADRVLGVQDQPGQPVPPQGLVPSWAKLVRSLPGVDVALAAFSVKNYPPLAARYYMWAASTDMISPLRSWPISCPEESPMCRVASGSSRARPRA
jgi:hypothetical protein